MKLKIQKRTFVLDNIEVRAQGDDKGRTLTGYAALFDVASQDLGGFTEIIRAGAFTKTLAEADIRALKNHNPDYVLGRTKSGTLRLEEDEKGLRVEIDVPEAQWALDLVASIERGDIDQMSFAFRAVKDRWTHNDDEPDLRELIEVKLFEVSPVTWPAYTETEISARALRAMGDHDVEDDDAGEEVLEERKKETEAEPPLAGHSADQLRRRLELAERI